MFRSARIKLTASYLTIIMSITLSFSGIIYQSFISETRLALQRHERRMELRFGEFPGFQAPQGRFQEELNIETIEEVRENLLTALLVINTGILAISGALGYWLAGRTLKPIESMTEKQKEFIADAAHELKTPLTSIKTMIEVDLRNKNLKISEVKNTMKSVVEEIDSLTNLTNSLLKQSAYENPSSNMETFDLGDVIKTAVKKVKPKANSKKVKINVKTESINVRADKKSISELITILLDNAVKFNFVGGEVNISIKARDKSVEIKVDDTGMGINEKDQDKIFDRFYKSDKSRVKSESDGFGLGLSIAKQIVENHKGKISVASKPDKGSTFRVLMPVTS